MAAANTLLQATLKGDTIKSNLYVGLTPDNLSHKFTPERSVQQTNNQPRQYHHFWDGCPHYRHCPIVIDPRPDLAVAPTALPSTGTCACQTSTPLAPNSAAPANSVARRTPCAYVKTNWDQTEINMEDLDKLELKIAQNPRYRGEWGWPGLGNVEVKAPADGMQDLTREVAWEKEIMDMDEKSKQRRDSAAYEKV